jgi:8-oxo-dGTP diphosphatase
MIDDSGAGTEPPRRVKRSVSLAIRDADGGLLLVQRPPDDEELPGAWGLPAATLQHGESCEAAVERAARDKLGIDVRPGRVLGRGEQERAGYRLEMRLYEATLLGGEPHVPQPVPGVTQYSGWRWGLDDDVRPAAERGSLCSRLMLEAGGRAGG